MLNERSTTQGVVERKTTIPILSNLLVEAKGNRLTIAATDLELSIRRGPGDFDGGVVGAPGFEPGASCAQGRRKNAI
jgi:hypothetical protein